MKWTKFILPSLGFLVVLFLLGPRAQFDAVDPIIEPLSLSLDELENYITAKEQKVIDLKPENEAKLVWADSIRKTPYSMVYLHGFSASRMESFPVHQNLAQRYGCNIFYARLSDHGRFSDESFLKLTPAKMLEDAKEAIAIGNLIGDKVIVMSCSTGGTFSIYLAAHNPDMVDAQILYSPNIALEDPAATLVTGPWGVQIAKAVMGDYRYIVENEGTEKAKYWNVKYRSEGVIALQAALDMMMTSEVFEQIKSPFFLGYYYKNDNEKDFIISTEAILEFVSTVQTPPTNYEVVPFPEVGNHVISSSLQSQDIESVERATMVF
ncbi:MAG: alpha/beta hydrolase, partial [Cyclobacteriaceae bacterium]|nr:alpha/beta hydrolase [Cyclobacteriaceae bacterium HetDA_MAG_MS6]